MRRTLTALAIAATLALTASAQAHKDSAPYKLLSTTRVGGEGGFDYVTADSTNRRLYVARSVAPPNGHVDVYNLDTLAFTGSIHGVSAHGAVVDEKLNHGFTASKPVVMFDAKTLATIKTLDVKGNPDGYLSDPFNQRVYILSHAAPNVTVIDAADGNILGTIDLGGAPEQAVTDGRGHLYIDLEDKDAIAIVDAKTMTMTGKYSIAAKGGGCAGLAMDVKHDILFAACRDKKNMIILSAKDGHIITDLPIGAGTDGATFNPKTMEAFSSQGDGTLTVIKEKSPTEFVVSQTVTTPVRARTLTLDTKTGHILLITATYTPAPVTNPPTARPRPIMTPGSFSILTIGK